MEMVNVSYTGNGINYQDLSPADKRLVTSNLINSSFGAPEDYIELYIYSQAGDLLEVDYDASDYYPYIQNNPKNNTYSSLTLDPEKDARNRGYDRGNVNLQYNFYKRLFNSSLQGTYWIKEISLSRNEIKLASQTISDSFILNGFNNYQAYISAKNYYPVFYLNFGNNVLLMANNVAYTSDDQGSYLLVKLYEPLPSNYETKSELWIVDKIAESVNFNVDISVDSVVTTFSQVLKGPNYNVNVNAKNSQTTPYYNYQNLIGNAITSSYQKLSSFYQDKAISINVDYSDFSNFVHFSSAVERVNNFVYKLGLIESSSANIAQQKSIIGGSSTVTILSQSISAEQQAIDNIIKNFDIYEYFLYFDSSSWAWPKSTSTQPYQLYSVTSSVASNFLGGTGVLPTPTTQSLLWSASYHDSTNKDLFHNSIPQYILEDPVNQPYVTFLDMVGQHFDNIWVYYKDVTNRYNSTNNPNTGISMDMVADALKGMGMQLYTNTNVSDNLYYTLFGINPGGNLLPPTGSEWITKYVTSSIATLPAETIQDEIYKRLYHNLPYLYKTKGTARSIKSIVSIYGIPEEILTVREFGGNFTGSLDGVIDLNSSDLKVTAYTSSVNISSSLLSPYTTIQYYAGSTRLNSSNIEVGFSPSDVINNNISSSLGAFNIDQLIGSPIYRYSSSYSPLVSASNAYFSTYTQKNSVWEYIRLLKFYNNSLFKTIKDFVPARANVSTGIIIKSHMFERNKYARHEPTVTFNEYSQSIDMISVSGSEGGALTDSTEWSTTLVTPIGTTPYTSSTGIEKFNGELGGSEIVVTNGLPFPQYLTTRGYNFLATSNELDTNSEIIPANYQNVLDSERSKFLLDLDYNSNQEIPVNYNAITYSLNESSVNNYGAYTNPNNPYARVQDSNYYFTGLVNAKYSGTKLESQYYNTYTDGDQSYGKTAAIDKIKYQYAYIVNIFSSSFQMPYRAKGQIKYIIDNNENVLNLSKTNTNWFSVQNIFKTGESADVSLFDYDPTNPYIQKLNNSDSDFTIWESGYSYTPLIYNNSGSLTYILDTPQVIPGTPAIPSSTVALQPTDNDYWTTFSTKVFNPGGGTYIAGITGSAIAGIAPTTAAVTINYYLTNAGRTPNRWPDTGTGTAAITIPVGTSPSYKITISLGGTYSSWNGDTPTFNISSETTGSAGTPAGQPIITSSSLDLNTSWKVISPGNVILLSATQSYYYGDFTSTGSYSGLDAFVFPFEVNSMDIVRLYNYSTSRWDQGGEFRVTSIQQQNIDSINYIALTVDNIVDPIYTQGSTSYPLTVYKYLVLKRLQDETSVYFNYDLPQPINQDGTLFPQYIGEGIKEGSGNVIKSLKQQNLI